MLDEYLGKEAPVVYTEIIRRNPAIVEVACTRLRLPFHLQQRIGPTPDDAAHIEATLKLRAKSGLPFWESFLIVALERGRVSEQALTAILEHQSTNEVTTRLSRADVLGNGLLEHAATSSRDFVIALLSEVTTDTGAALHLPMIDFRCDRSARNLRIVVGICSRLFRGHVAIFESGHSYHACGLVLVEVSELLDLLARSLLFNPIVDRAYVAHQIIERRCCLRISRKEDLGPPRLVEVI